MSKRSKEKRPEELSLFLNELGMFFSGGVPFYDAFLIMAENTGSARERALLTLLAQKIDQGKELSEALGEAGCYPDHMIRMIRIGESSGKLEEVLDSLSIYYHRQEHLRASIRSAVVYPLVMVLVMLAILAVLMIKVLPVFSQVFDQVGAQLPAPLAAIAHSSSTAAIISAIFVCLILLLLIGYCIARRTAAGQAFLTRLPLTRKIFEKTEAARFANSMALLLASGISSDEAVDMILTLTRSPRSREKLTKLQNLLNQGETLPRALTVSGVLSSKYAAMIAVGMKTGNTEEMMDLAAQRQSDDTDRSIERLIAGVEPAVVIIMCLIIGSILLSVMLPLMKIMTSM